MLNNGSVYNSAPRIQSLKADNSGNLNLENPLNGEGAPVYATKADLSSVYGADGVIKMPASTFLLATMVLRMLRQLQMALCICTSQPPI